MKIIIIILAVISTYSISADVLMIDRIQSSQGHDIPAKGTTMSQVEAKYGKPNINKGPIGSPPITIWNYDNFSVYFEYKHVIHAVVHQANANEKGPKPIE